MLNDKIYYKGENNLSEVPIRKINNFYHHNKKSIIANYTICQNCIIIKYINNNK